MLATAEKNVNLPIVPPLHMPRLGLSLSEAAGKQCSVKSGINGSQWSDTAATGLPASLHTPIDSNPIAPRSDANLPFLPLQRQASWACLIIIT